MKFAWWKFMVCWFCWLHLRHWPWSDLSDEEWRDAFRDDSDPWSAFLEGWCRE